MSLLSSFIQNQLLKALEAEFALHAPEVQAVIVTEVTNFANQALQWVEAKLNDIQQPKE